MSATQEATAQPDEASTSSVAAVSSDEDDGAVLSQLLTKKITLRNGETMYRIYSRRCRPVLAYKGFIFHYHKQLAACNITWRCVNSHKHNIGFTCNARVRTNWAMTDLQSVGKPHNERCTSDEKAVRLKGALNDINISAEFWSGSLTHLYEEFVGSLKKTDADLLPLFPSLSDETFMKSLEAHRTNRLFRKEFRARKIAEEKYKKAAPRKPFSANSSIIRTFPETICCECGESVETQENLVAHLRSEHHDDTLKVETFRFDDRLTASRWLRHVHTSSNGSLASLTLDPVDGVVYHLCSLDERIQGSNCTGIHCPAFVKIRMHGEDCPTVDYCLNHSFHGDDEANRRATLIAPSTFVEQMSVIHIEGRQRRVGAMQCRVLTAFSSSVRKPGDSDIATNPNRETHSETVMDQLELPLSGQADTLVPAKSNRLGARSRSSLVEPMSLTGDAPISSVKPATSTPSRQPVLKRQLQKRHCSIDSVIAEIDVECKLILQGSKQMQSVEVAQKCAQLLQEARNMMVQDPCFDYRTSAGSGAERRVLSPPPKIFKYGHSPSRKSPSVSKSTDNLKKQSTPIVVFLDKRSRKNLSIS